MKRLIYLLPFMVAPAQAGEFDPSPYAKQGCPADFFTQKATVFNAVTICATNQVPIDKLRHAANVAAQWLDNDQDGQVDQTGIVNELQGNRATLVMSARGFSDQAFEQMDIDGIVGQDLSAEETNPDADRDASQEEIHHLILNAGWQGLFPNVFSDQSSQQSELYRQWQTAEQKGYYFYDDPTCDDACKVTEFFYLATAAYSGSQADLFSDEMRLKTRKALSDKLPGTVAIIESESYHYPNHIWPDGHYKHQNNIHIE
ncbi:hypothetical protein ACXAAV_07050 [Vibrio coralliilyticus]